MPEIVIDTPDGPMPAWIARPDGVVPGGVVVVQEAFGLTDHIKRVTDRVADAGWLAVAPALFHREGSPVFGYDELEKLMPLFRVLSASAIEIDVEATFGWLMAEGIPTNDSASWGSAWVGPSPSPPPLAARSARP